MHSSGFIPPFKNKINKANPNLLVSGQDTKGPLFGKGEETEVPGADKQGRSAWLFALTQATKQKEMHVMKQNDVVQQTAALFIRYSHLLAGGAAKSDYLDNGARAAGDITIFPDMQE